MFAMFAAVYLHAQTPKTFEDLELAKINELRGERNFQSSTRFVTDQGETEDVVVNTSRASISYEGKQKAGNTTSSGSTDGVLSLIFTSQNKALYKMGGILTDFPRGIRTVLNPDQMLVNFTAGRQIQFGSDPQFVLQGITTVQENGQPFRKAVATASLKRGSATVTQWFMPDKWIMTRFSLTVKHDEDQFSCKWQVTLQN